MRSILRNVVLYTKKPLYCLTLTLSTTQNFPMRICSSASQGSKSNHREDFHTDLENVDASIGLKSSLPTANKCLIVYSTMAVKTILLDQLINNMEKIGNLKPVRNLQVHTRNKRVQNSRLAFQDARSRHVFQDGVTKLARWRN